MNVYILEGKTPVKASLDVWAAWFTDADRTVARTETVSTIFLGVDYSLSENDPPILFETLVLGGPLEHERERYATWAEAEEGHLRMVARVEKAK